MKYKAILFDMDGTLVPMDMQEFINGYFKFLAKKLAPFISDSKKLINAVWVGFEAMVKNDGHVTNYDIFWEEFGKVTGENGKELRDCCEEFYGKEFNEAKIFTKENPLAVKAVELAHKKAPIVCLSTNPVFPMVGQKTRMGWVGLAPSDFDLVTSYETDSYCKPNPMYFTTVCERLKVQPEECLLIGNDEYEDMFAGTKAGLHCFLVTDTAIYSKEHPWDGDKGSFKNLIDFLNKLD